MNAQATRAATRVAFPIALFALLFCSWLRADNTCPVITSVTRTEGGLIRLEMPLGEEQYAVLYRADGLIGTGRAIAIARPVGGMVTLTDPAPIPSEGFLEIHTHNTAAPADTDGDGINDLIELPIEPDGYLNLWLW